MWIFQWLLLSASQALAQSGGSPPPGGGGAGQGIEIQNPLACEEAGACIQGILNGLAILAAPIASVMIIIGGFQLMAGGGNEEKIKKGKATIIYATVGYAVILLSLAVTAVVRDALGGPSGS